MTDLPPKLSDWPPWGFIEDLLAQLPAPTHPETGEPLWDKGVRPHGQQRILLESRCRFLQATGGVRAGKSFEAALRLFVDICWRILNDRRGDFYWVIGPTYELAEEEMRHLDSLLSWAEIPHEMRTPQNSSWTLSVTGYDIAVETRTGADAAKIAARAPRGIVLAEAHQLAAGVWNAARQRVVQTRGWVFIEGTFEDDPKGDWFRQLATDWRLKKGDHFLEKPGALGFSVPLPSWENIVLFPGGRDDPAIRLEEEALGPLFLEKYGGEPIRSSNAAMPYAHEAHHIRHRYPWKGTSFDPEQPVFLAIDPGLAHAFAALAVQVQANEIWIIDAVYRWGRGVELMVEEATQRPWSKNVEHGVIDFAATQRKAEGPPVIGQWQNLWWAKTGTHMSLYTAPVPLATGYGLHNRALLNSWPPKEANRWFNRDGKLRPEAVVNPVGMRLYIDPLAAPPLFGGMVDGRQYSGEYRLHKKRARSDGAILRDEFIDTDNDAIKAINYFLTWYDGVLKMKSLMALGDNGSIPFEILMSGSKR